MTRNKFNCPSCHQPLAVASYAGYQVLWCGYGPCMSLSANEGATGLNEALAFAELEQAVLKEMAEREELRAEIRVREAENLEWKRRAEDSRYAP